MPELKNEFQIPRAEETPFGDGDQLDFRPLNASENRTSLEAAHNLLRIADEAAQVQLDQVQQTPEIPAITSRLFQIGANVVWLRHDYDISHINLN